VERTIEHKKLGLRATIKPLRQRDLESFGAAFAPESITTASQRRGANLRAAIRAGWFTDLQPAMTADEVGDQPPAVVRYLGEFVEAVYGEVTTVPPD
jgi:hypothetical protein